jgi:hypothetical protein
VKNNIDNVVAELAGLIGDRYRVDGHDVSIRRGSGIVYVYKDRNLYDWWKVHIKLHRADRACVIYDMGVGKTTGPMSVREMLNYFVAISVMDS